MNLATSLMAFSNAIPAEFGSAPGVNYDSSFTVQLQNKGSDLATGDTVAFLTADVKQPNSQTNIDNGQPSTVSSTITNISSIAGLSISAAGSLTFDPTNAAYSSLSGTKVYSISGTYNITDSTVMYHLVNLK